MKTILVWGVIGVLLSLFVTDSNVACGVFVGGVLGSLAYDVDKLKKGRRK